MRKIILFGLQNETNLGDRIIGSCTEWIVNRIVDELGLSNFEIISVDMRGPINSKNGNIKRKKDSYKEYLKKLFPKSIRNEINHWRNYFSDWKNEEKVRARTKLMVENYIDHDVKAIVFVGGGIIKYKAQEFYLLIDEIVGFADKLEIPVMFNAVGVEGYNPYSRKCKILKEALNKKCVKVITTRDDIVTLMKYLKINNHCRVKQVADPAFWSDIVYKSDISNEKTYTVGLSVARAGLFLDHGINIDEKTLINFWKELALRLDSLHVSWRFLCNGTEADYAFLEKLLEEAEFKDRKDLVAFPCAHDGGELVNQISQFKGMIACRLHAGIVSYSLCIPEIMLVWNDKQRKFSQFIGYPNRCLERKDISASVAVEMITSIVRVGYPNYIKDEKRKETYNELKKFLCRLEE
jgi:polysaccharide pyruvyl transferase WcaK-like protein